MLLRRRWPKVERERRTKKKKFGGMYIIGQGSSKNFSPRFLCRLTALINGYSKIINAVKRQRNLGLEEFIQEPEIRARKPKMCILQI